MENIFPPSHPGLRIPTLYLYTYHIFLLVWGCDQTLRDSQARLSFKPNTSTSTKYCSPRKDTVKADVFSPGKGLWSHPEKPAYVSICQHWCQQFRQHLSAQFYYEPWGAYLRDSKARLGASCLSHPALCQPVHCAVHMYTALYTCTQHTLCSGWSRTRVSIRVQLPTCSCVADKTSGTRCSLSSCHATVNPLVNSLQLPGIQCFYIGIHSVYKLPGI